MQKYNTYSNCLLHTKTALFCICNNMGVIHKELYQLILLASSKKKTACGNLQTQLECEMNQLSLNCVNRKIDILFDPVYEK